MVRLHLVCRNRANLEAVEHPSYASGNWNLPLEEARRLIGGMIYFHETKKEASYFGGVVTGVEPIVPETTRNGRVRFLLTSTRAAKAIPWAGAPQSVAWSGGIIED